MSTTYAQKQSPTQKKDAPTAASILDTSSQSESLQRKADMANNVLQCFTIPAGTLDGYNTHVQQKRTIEDSYDGMVGAINIFTPYVHNGHPVFHTSKKNYDTIYSGTGVGAITDPMSFLGKAKHYTNTVYKVSDTPTERNGVDLNAKQGTPW